MSGLHNIKVLRLRNFTDEDGNEYSVHARLTLFIMQYAVFSFGRSQLWGIGQILYYLRTHCTFYYFFTIQWQTHLNKKLHVDYTKRYSYPYASGIKHLYSNINDDSYHVFFLSHMRKNIYRKYNSLNKSKSYSWLIIS